MNKEIFKKVVMWGIIGLIMIAVSFSACERFYERLDIKPDNPIEEAAEEVIKDQTGVDLDLSPETPESKEK